MELISRQEAKAQSKIRYFTGLLCKNNHIAERYVSTHQCSDCVTSSRPAYVPVIKDIHPRTTAKLTNQMTYNTGSACSEGHVVDRYTSTGNCITCHALYYSSEEQKLKQHEYRGLSKDKKAAYDKEFDKNNKEYRSALKSENRAKRINRKASWDNEFTRFVFEEAIHLAAIRKNATGYAWHVDHVIPLNGKLVSGLHVWNNFAVIPAAQNMSKGNRYTTE
jgi:hypothetical protein